LWLRSLHGFELASEGQRRICQNAIQSLQVHREG
jgi:hypothetical protein